MRGHTGRKPFKCDKCNCSCIDKFMLNSHLKSLSNIYPYRCAQCPHATKYHHSLKQQFRKYNHQPNTELNLDGTPNRYTITEMFGTRRGFRPKKSTSSSDSSSLSNSTASRLDFSNISHHSTSFQPARSGSPCPSSCSAWNRNHPSGSVL